MTSGGGIIQFHSKLQSMASCDPRIRVISVIAIREAFVSNQLDWREPKFSLAPAL